MSTVENVETWDERFSVGVHVLDEQHKKLLHYVQVLKGLMQGDHLGVIHELLTRITEYAILHFEAEETLLEHHGYPIDAQQASHMEFESWITQTNEQASNGNINVAEVYAYLSEWWVRHILEEDMRYKDFLCNEGVR